MKRLLTIIAVVTVALLGAVFFAPVSVQAAALDSKQPIKNGSKNPDACLARYDGITVSKLTYAKLKNGKAGPKNNLDAGCFSRLNGNCNAQVTNSQASIYTVSCTEKADSNNESAGLDEEGNSTPAVGSEAEGIKDPALTTEAVCNKDRCELITKYVNPLILLLTILVGLAVVIGIIVGGIEVSTSAGDPQRAASGKNHIRNALIAVVGYLLLFGLLQFLLPGGFL